MTQAPPATRVDIDLALAAANLVAQFSSNNPMPPPAIAGMIKTVHEALVDLVDNGPRANVAPEPKQQSPIVTIASEAVSSRRSQNVARTFEPASVLALESPLKKPVGARKDPKNAFQAEYVQSEPNAEPFLPVDQSVFTDRILCLECGKAFSNIMRHIKAYHHLSDRDYRIKYGLSAKYPFSSPDYVKQRSDLATKNKTRFRPLTREEHRARRTANDQGGPPMAQADSQS